jgi:hypothetical protein
MPEVVPVMLHEESYRGVGYTILASPPVAGGVPRGDWDRLVAKLFANHANLVTPVTL